MRLIRPDFIIKRFYAQYNIDGTVEVTMPALSPSMDEGKLVEWQVNVGDKVQMGDVIASIETDKATMDFESPEDGFVAKILVEAGETVPVNQLIALMVPSKEDIEKLDVSSGASKKESKAPQQSEPVKQQSQPKSAVPNVPHEVIGFPALSPNMTSGKLVRWLKQPGDRISAGDELAEIETDKAVNTFEASDDGYLASILVDEGEVRQLHEPIAIIVENESDIDAVKDYRPTSEQEEASPSKPEESKSYTAETASESSPTRARGDRIIASPLAKKLAAEKGYDISEIKGTGPRGRIIAADIREYQPTARAREEPRRVAPPSAAPGLYPEFTDTETGSIRKVIASRLTESKQTIPHYYLTIECQFDALLNLRKELNEMGGGKYKLSVNDFLMKAAASAMRAVPIVNAEWRGDVIRQYKDVNINVAVSTDRGLITPVVRNVNKKSLSEISTSVRDLANKARDSSLKLNELEGGTFTISNLGMYGITQFAAVINPPQAAILAAGSPVKRLSLNANGEPEEKTYVNFTLSCDHRVIDGAVGAQWLQEYKRIIENPIALMV